MGWYNFSYTSKFKYLNVCFSGGQIAVLAFSTTDRDSFDAIASWKTKVNTLYIAHVIHDNTYYV